MGRLSQGCLGRQVGGRGTEMGKVFGFGAGAEYNAILDSVVVFVA